MKRSYQIIILLVLFAVSTNAQWQIEWTSSAINNAYVLGWIGFEKTGDTWVNRPYSIDINTFKIMESIYSTNTLYSYTFTQAEKDAGYLLYSLKTDLTGDGITEFYVLSSYGTASPYRQGVKIINITNNTILLELNNANNYYSTPTIWDVDNDGILECLIAKYDYPNFVNGFLVSYNTGITTNVLSDSPTQIKFELKQNYPNPFNPQTEIEFSIESEDFVSIDIYSINGELIRNLINERLSSGTHKVTWNGSTSNGERLSSGVYFYQLKVGNTSTIKKMILLK